MLELSCADYTFPLLGRREVFALLRLLQFDFVDIGLFERSQTFHTSDLLFAHRPFMQCVRDDLEAAELRAADVFLQVGAHPTQSSANDPDKRVRQLARDAFSLALELCSAVRCGHITGLPGVAHGDPSRDFALAAEEAAWRVEASAKAGFVYAIEPHIASVCGDTKTTRTFLAEVPGLTLTLDYGHFLFQGELNEHIHPLLPHASHLHLRGAARGRLQTPAAESAVDLPHIVSNSGPHDGGKLALEYVWTDWHDCDRTDNLSETLLMRRRITEMEAQLDQGATHHV